MNTKGKKSKGIPKSIPGYYYDPAKNRYFKVSSDYPGASTQTQNRVDLKKEVVNDAKEHLPTVIQLLDWQKRGRYGHSLRFEREIKRCMLHSLPRKQVECLHQIEGHVSHCQVGSKQLQFSISNSLLAVAEKLRQDAGHLLKVYDVQVDGSSCYLNQCFDAISPMIDCIRWHPQARTLMFLSNRGFMKKTKGVIETYCFTGNEAIGHHLIKVSNVRLCCEWCRQATSSVNVAFGGHGAVYLSDNLGASCTTISIGKSDVLTLGSAAESDLMLAGCRNGSVHLVDYRTKKSSCVTRSDRNGGMLGIDGLKSLRGDVNYAASSMNGQINLFDLRKPNTLATLQGHVNTHHQLGFALSHDEEYLAAVGEDGKVRLWTLCGPMQPSHRPVRTLSPNNDSSLHFSAVEFGPPIRSALLNLFCISGDQLHIYNR